MQKAGIAFLAAVLFGLLFVYTANTVSPWNNAKLETFIERNEIATGSEFNQFIDELIDRGLVWQVLNRSVFVAMLVIMGGVLINAIAAIHLFIDKVFTKKFFEQPDIFTAYRRAAFIYVFVLTLLMTKLLGGNQLVNGGGVVLLLVAAELLIRDRS